MVCYCKGGAFVVIDANLVFGRIFLEYFLKIFGLNEDEVLDYEFFYKVFEEVMVCINVEIGESLLVEEVVMGFLRVVNEVMCRSIREITESKGYEILFYVLVVFGGVGL